MNLKEHKIYHLSPDNRMGIFLRFLFAVALKRVCNEIQKAITKKAMEGKIPEFTGISAPYKEPLNPEFVVDTEAQTADEIVKDIVDRVRNRTLIA